MKIKISLLIIILGLLVSPDGFGQPENKAKEVFDLVNMARVTPALFLSTYKKELEACSPQFVKVLEKAQPIQKVIWDKGLELMQKDRLLTGNLNPKYQGKMDGFVLSSSGKGSGFSQLSALHILCQFYTSITDPAHSHLGIYITDSSYAIGWGLSTTINNRKPFFYAVVPDTTNVNFKLLNTAANATYMNAFERDIIREMNFARVYPAVYADIVGKFIEKKSEIWKGLNKDEIEATYELIDQLKKAKPLGLLYPKECLYLAAEKHGLDCKNREFTDHTGSDGSSPFDRIKKFCDGVIGSENIVGTVDGDVRVSVIALLVDDGISNRGHRYNILNPEWKYVGCYFYENKKQEYPQYYILGGCIQNFSK